MDRMGRTDFADEFFRNGLDIADQEIVVDLFERWLLRERLVDEHRTLHDLLPSPQARREARLVARILGEAQPLFLAVRNVCKAIDGDVRILQRYALGAISVLDDLVLLGQQRDAPDPAR